MEKSIMSFELSKQADAALRLAAALSQVSRSEFIRRALDRELEALAAKLHATDYAELLRRQVDGRDE